MRTTKSPPKDIYKCVCERNGPFNITTNIEMSHKHIERILTHTQTQSKESKKNQFHYIGRKLVRAQPLEATEGASQYTHNDKEIFLFFVTVVYMLSYTYRPEDLSFSTLLPHTNVKMVYSAKNAAFMPLYVHITHVF